MIISKELLTRLETKIGHTCQVVAIPDKFGLKLRARAKNAETGDRLFTERLITFEEMLRIVDHRILQDHFAVEAKHYFDRKLPS